ncbi:Ig-like domain-containing protein [Pontiellaceae bacterium B12219]|nr:Ig-like domain-containing protein [Pontiellaceae bacterium B12219]
MRKKMVMTATVAGFVAASHAAITPLNYAGATEYDGGNYELFTGSSANGEFEKSLSTSYLGQTVTVEDDFDLGAISILYTTDDGAGVSDVTVHVYEVTNALAASFAPWPPSNTLFSGTFDAPAPSGVDTLFLSLGTNISLTAGSAYMILLDGTAASSTAFNWMRSTDTADFYAGGLAVDNDGASASNRDFPIGLGLTPDVTANDDEYILAGISGTTVDAPGVLANDFSADSAMLVSDISSGSLTFNSDGSFSCSGLVNGTNTFTYAAVSGAEVSAPATVVLFAVLEEDPPTAVDDSYLMDFGLGDSNIVGNVLNNDINNSLVYDLSAMAGDYTVNNGTLNVSTDGDFTYTPNAGFTGTETFTYKAYTPLATSVVATVTLTVEDNDFPGAVIDIFDTYDNSATVDLKDIPAANDNWFSGNSGQIEIRNGDGVNKYLKVGWSGNRYRGATSRAALFAGIPDSSTEYWLYCELNPASTSIDGLFGVSTDSSHTVGTTERGDFAAGIRVAGEGLGVVDVYALTGGDSSTDVLLTSGVAAQTWHGIWLNINNAANTYDVYLGDAGDAGTLGTQIGTNIVFNGGNLDLVSVVASATATMYVDNILNVDSFTPWINQPATLSGVSLAANDTLQLTIGLDIKDDVTDYWPVRTDDLVYGEWEPVAHSDAPDGTFAVTSLGVASGDETNKVIYLKTTNTVEFFRIENNQ